MKISCAPYELLAKETKVTGISSYKIRIDKNILQECLNLKKVERFVFTTNVLIFSVKDQF